MSQQYEEPNWAEQDTEYITGDEKRGNMREQKLHLKLKGKPLCNAKRGTRKFKYAPSQDQLTCQNCRRAVRS